MNKVPTQVPLRVDFAGGWLDVPKLSVKHGFIINCAIAPMVSLIHWPYERCSGLGGSAAYAILNGLDAVASEDALGVGWQDPAIIQETGLCVWRSGKKPILDTKINPDFLIGKMALKWLGKSHNTPGLVDLKRDYETIRKASIDAALGVRQHWYPGILQGIRWTYLAQLEEGMQELPEIDDSLAKKYCGGGWGGYALYMFPDTKTRDSSKLLRIEPYITSL